MKKVRLALIGSPNSGKTAFFNALTGLKKKSANYPGVTVECHFGHCMLPNVEIEVVDLPGLNSLQAESFDEYLTRDFVLGRPNKYFSQKVLEQHYDHLVLVVDVVQLEKSLYLAMELMELGIDFQIILTHQDKALLRGQKIDFEGWSKAWNKVLIAIDNFNPHDINKVKAIWNQLLPKDQATINPNALDIIAHPTFVGKAFQQIDATLQQFRINAARPEKFTQRLDHILTHPVAGFFAMVIILLIVFEVLFELAAPLQDAMESAFNFLTNWCNTHLATSMFHDFLTQGVIAGLGAVAVFLPQIILLSLMITLLEESGYLSRVAFLLDKLMKRLYLPGKAIVPLLSSHACAIPGIIAARNLNREEDRLTTMLIAPLTTCSARIPVYVLLIAALFPTGKWMGVLSYRSLALLGLYLLGIVVSILAGYILKKKVFKTRANHLLVELPRYQLPRLRTLIQNVKMQSMAFLKKAGGIILVLTIVLWALSYFPRAADGTSQNIEESYAGKIGHVIQPILSPLGFDWKIATALIPSFAAREVMVASLATVYAVDQNNDSGTNEATEKLSGIMAANYSLGTLAALLIWFAFAPQCIATFAILRKETNSYFWPSITFGYSLSLAYLGGVLVKLFLG